MAAISGAQDGPLLYIQAGSDGNELDTVKSNVEGIFWRKSRLPMVATGESVCQIGLNPREVTFEE